MLVLILYGPLARSLAIVRRFVIQPMAINRSCRRRSHQFLDSTSQFPVRFRSAFSARTRRD